MEHVSLSVINAFKFALCDTKQQSSMSAVVTFLSMRLGHKTIKIGDQDKIDTQINFGHICLRLDKSSITQQKWWYMPDLH